MSTARTIDVLVVGGGQSALAAGFYLRRSGLSYVLLDDQEGPGAAWRHAWPSLRLFSPVQWSGLPGWQMPGPDEYAGRDAVVAYLAEYERRYALPVLRTRHVREVRDDPASERLRVVTEEEQWLARAVISATGSWSKPVVPSLPGAAQYRGRTLHSARYAGPASFAGQRVVVVGGGNSGAQIVAELSEVATATWACREPPTFLPDDVDGRVLFTQATARYRALQEGRTPDPPRSLGDVVMVPPVRAARDRGDLVAEPMFERFTARGVAWPDGLEREADAVIWATGFRPALDHVAPLGVLGADGRVVVRGTRSVEEPRLWLLGYGEWTGFASATLIGVGRSARATVDEIRSSLDPSFKMADGPPG